MSVPSTVLRLCCMVPCMVLHVPRECMRLHVDPWFLPPRFCQTLTLSVSVSGQGVSGLGLGLPSVSGGVTQGSSLRARAGGAQEGEEAEDDERRREVARRAEQGGPGGLGRAGAPACPRGGAGARGWGRSSACSGVRVPCALGRRGSQGAGEGRARGGRGAPTAERPPLLCSRQAKKRLSFLLGQSELFKHFGLKEVRRAPRTRSAHPLAIGPKRPVPPTSPCAHTAAV